MSAASRLEIVHDQIRNEIESLISSCSPTVFASLSEPIEPLPTMEFLQKQQKEFYNRLNPPKSLCIPNSLTKEIEFLLDESSIVHDTTSQVLKNAFEQQLEDISATEKTYLDRFTDPESLILNIEDISRQLYNFSYQRTEIVEASIRNEANVSTETDLQMGESILNKLNNKNIPFKAFLSMFQRYPMLKSEKILTDSLNSAKNDQNTNFDMFLGAPMSTADTQGRLDFLSKKLGITSKDGHELFFAAESLFNSSVKKFQFLDFVTLPSLPRDCLPSQILSFLYLNSSEKDYRSEAFFNSLTLGNIEDVVSKLKLFSSRHGRENRITPDRLLAWRELQYVNCRRLFFESIEGLPREDQSVVRWTVLVVLGIILQHKSECDVASVAETLLSLEAQLTSQKLELLALCPEIDGRYLRPRFREGVSPEVSYRLIIERVMIMKDIARTLHVMLNRRQSLGKLWNLFEMEKATVQKLTHMFPINKFSLEPYISLSLWRVLRSELNSILYIDFLTETPLAYIPPSMIPKSSSQSFELGIGKCKDIQFISEHFIEIRLISMLAETLSIQLRVLPDVSETLASLRNKRAILVVLAEFRNITLSRTLMDSFFSEDEFSSQFLLSHCPAIEFEIDYSNNESLLKTARMIDDYKILQLHNFSEKDRLDMRLRVRTLAKIEAFVSSRRNRVVELEFTRSLTLGPHSDMTDEEFEQRLLLRIMAAMLSSLEKDCSEAVRTGILTVGEEVKVLWANMFSRFFGTFYPFWVDSMLYDLSDQFRSYFLDELKLVDEDVEKSGKPPLDFLLETVTSGILKLAYSLLLVSTDINEVTIKSCVCLMTPDIYRVAAPTFQKSVVTRARENGESVLSVLSQNINDMLCQAQSAGIQGFGEIQKERLIAAIDGPSTLLRPEIYSKRRRSGKLGFRYIPTPDDADSQFNEELTYASAKIINQVKSDNTSTLIEKLVNADRKSLFTIWPAILRNMSKAYAASRDHDSLVSTSLTLGKLRYQAELENLVSNRLYYDILKFNELREEMRVLNSEQKTETHTIERETSLFYENLISDIKQQIDRQSDKGKQTDQLFYSSALDTINEYLDDHERVYKRSSSKGSINPIDTSEGVKLRISRVLAKIGFTTSLSKQIKKVTDSETQLKSSLLFEKRQAQSEIENLELNLKESYKKLSSLQAEKDDMIDQLDKEKMETSQLLHFKQICLLQYQKLIDIESYLTSPDDVDVGQLLKKLSAAHDTLEGLEVEREMFEEDIRVSVREPLEQTARTARRIRAAKAKSGSTLRVIEKVPDIETDIKENETLKDDNKTLKNQLRELELRYEGLDKRVRESVDTLFDKLPPIPKTARVKRRVIFKPTKTNKPAKY